MAGAKWRVTAATGLAALFAGAASVSMGQAPAAPAPPRDFSRARQSVVDYTRGVAEPAAACAALKTAGFGPQLQVLQADEVGAAGGAPPTATSWA